MGNEKEEKAAAVPNRVQPWKKLVSFGNEVSGPLHVDENFALQSTLEEKDFDEVQEQATGSDISVSHSPSSLLGVLIQIGKVGLTLAVRVYMCKQGQDFLREVRFSSVVVFSDSSCESTDLRQKFSLLSLYKRILLITPSN